MRRVEGCGERGCLGPVPLLPRGGREPALGLLPGGRAPLGLPRGWKAAAAAAKGLRRRARGRGRALGRRQRRLF